MKISVLIPAYNAARTIRATLDAVLAQTLAPDEIIVFDDGSTDDTADILKSYQPHVTVFRQSNQGVAHARNFLCGQASGDILAFLDADDLWHPQYLASQKQMIDESPDAVVWFTHHENFVGLGDFEWPNNTEFQSFSPEMFQPLAFIERYNQTPMSFQMSCCCIRKNMVAKFGPEPFRVSGAEDTFFHNLLPLLGTVVHTAKKLVAYRISDSSLSSNLQRVSVLIVDAFKILDGIYRAQASPALYNTFRIVYASRTRNCGKFLMGADQTREARRQFISAARLSRNPASVIKSIGLYGSTFLPRSLQPRWLTGERSLPLLSSPAVGGEELA